MSGRTAENPIYPENYRPNSAEEQASVLKRILRRLDTNHIRDIAASYPEFEGADAIYVIPKPTIVAAHVGLEDPYTDFGLLTELGPMAELQNQREFKNLQLGKMGSNYYRLNNHAKRVLMSLEEEQPGDVLVFPAQTGKLYAGSQIRNAQWPSLKPNQWPLPAYAVGWMLYTDPRRLEEYRDLAIDCPGDKYNLEGWGEYFDCALYFGFDGRSLFSQARFIADVLPGFGSATGFIQQDNIPK